MICVVTHNMHFLSGYNNMANFSQGQGNHNFGNYVIIRTLVKIC